MFPEWSVNKIADKIGIRERHIAAEGETAVDLAERAAQKLFEEKQVDRETVDFVLFCTQSPDYLLPTSACILQERLGLPKTCGALDFNLGCSGYIYGLSLAKGLVVGGMAKNVLLLTGDTYSKYIHKDDKSNRAIFGDAASATLVGSSGRVRIDRFVFGTDGSGRDGLIIQSGANRFPEGGACPPTLDASNFYSSRHLYMNGAAVFNFTLDIVPELVRKVLDQNDLDSKLVDRYVFHQANKFMLETLRKVCGIPEEKFYVGMERVGNTVSSSIPVALSDIKVVDDSSVHALLLAGFGVGLSWGGCVLTREAS